MDEKEIYDWCDQHHNELFQANCMILSDIRAGCTCEPEDIQKCFDIIGIDPICPIERLMDMHIIPDYSVMFSSEVRS